MNWFLDLTTRTKLFLSFGVMIVLLAMVMITAYRGITAIETSQKNLYAQEFANAVDLKDIRANQNGMRAALLAMLLVPKRSDQEARHQETKDRAKENDETMQRLRERARNDPELLRRLEEFSTIRSAFRQTQETELTPWIYEGKIEEAKQLALGIQAERNEQMRSIANECT
jgi:Four helix bundle sensory module for signal transduction